MKWLLLLLTALGAVVLGVVLSGRHGGPYNGPAVHAPLCGPHGNAKSPCRSPDGRWTVLCRPSGLVLTRSGGARRTLSGDYCGEIAWARPHRLVFTGDGGYSAYILDPATLDMLSVGFSNIYASPDGRWLLGDVYNDQIGGGGDDLGGLVSLATGRCFAVPGDASIGQDSGPVETGFTPDGSAVVVGPANGRRRYPISSLGQPCGAQILDSG